MPYVDGYVLPVPKANLDEYRRIASQAGALWREYGALEYRECAGEDLNVSNVVPFTRCVDAREDETVVFAWIVFESREHRDRVNARVLEDPRMNEMGPETAPFDTSRMIYGGFEVIVDA